MYSIFFDIYVARHVEITSAATRRSVHLSAMLSSSSPIIVRHTSLLCVRFTKALTKRIISHRPDESFACWRENYSCVHRERHPCVNTKTRSDTKQIILLLKIPLLKFGTGTYTPVNVNRKLSLKIPRQARNSNLPSIPSLTHKFRVSECGGAAF